MKKPTSERKTANTQKAGEKAETKLNRQQKNPQTKRGILRPNLSDIVLTAMLPMKWPAKMTEVETKGKEPRSHTKSN